MLIKIHFNKFSLVMDKMIFLSSFYAFPKKVKDHKVVARDFFYLSSFSLFLKSKILLLLFQIFVFVVILRP